MVSRRQTPEFRHCPESGREGCGTFRKKDVYNGLERLDLRKLEQSLRQ